MPSTIIIAVIAVLIIGSFVFSGISYSRQQALKKRKYLVKQFQQQADEAQSHISLLLRIDKDYDLIFKLQSLVVNALSSAFALNSENPVLKNNLSTQKMKLNDYKENQRNNDITCWVTSDNELSSTQTQLSQINKLLDLYRNRGALNPSAHQELQSHVQTLLQTLSTNTYLYQADIYAEQNNITSYQLYIKQAIQVIKKSTIETNQKNQKIKELSDRIHEIKRTGKVSGLKNFIKPAEIVVEEVNQETEISE